MTDLAHMDWPVRWVRERLGYEVRDVALFSAALTHRSAARSHNERLEFLGDAVLNLSIAEHLFRGNPQANEGDLSRLRASLVSSQPLAETAAHIGLGEVLRLGSGELKTGGFRRESILADALEAVIGAVYLDAGLGEAQRVIYALFAQRMAHMPDTDELKDSKTRLQEYLQSRGLAAAGLRGGAHRGRDPRPDLLGALRGEHIGLRRHRAGPEQAARRAGGCRAGAS